MLYGILPHSKMIKTVPVIADGSGDYKSKQQSLMNKEQTKPTRSGEKQICKRCKMEEYQQPHASNMGKCSKCKEAVSYHSFKCCTCGIQPLDPRLVLWDEGPNNARFDDGGYVSDEDGYWNDYY